MIKKAAMITIAGRPNVGKSTLLNTMVGEKVAIVTNKPQTTRNRISGVANRGETQFVFMDTPGYHKPRTKLGNYMVGVVRETVTSVDAVLLMVEPIAGIGPQERQLMEWLQSSGVPGVLVINKIDTVDKQVLLSVIDCYREAFAFSAIVPISAKSGDGLDMLVEELEKYALEGPPLFPEGMLTDQPERQIIAEIIREKLLLCLQREVPHGTAVEITQFSERDSGIIDVEATIFCEKASHKGMIIGKHGEMLKRIGALARADIETFMGTKVYLETWVKVKERWRDSDTMIKNFGYRE